MFSILPFVSLPIERRWGHCTLTHSVLALAAVGLVLVPTVFLSKTTYAALPIGYAAHLLADCATKTGVPLFYPHRARYVLPRSNRFRFHSSSTGEILLLAVLLLLLILVFPLAQRGGVWKALRELEVLNRPSEGGSQRSALDLLSYPLVVLDDVGRQPCSGRAAEQFYALIETLWSECRQVVLTTSLPPAVLVQRLDLAVLSRILGMCTLVSVKSKDLRVRKDRRKGMDETKDSADQMWMMLRDPHLDQGAELLGFLAKLPASVLLT